MTHLSDYSYLDRFIPNCFVLMGILYFCFLVRNARQDLTLDAFRKGKLQGVILLLYLLSLVLQLIYDALSVSIKYKEGYIDTCVTLNASILLDSPPCGACDGGGGDNGVCRLYPVQEPCRGIITKPGGSYTQESLDVLPMLDTFFNMACTTRNSALFMLLAYFNSSVKSLFPKPVMGRWEVRLFAWYSVLSIALYFILQEIFSFDPLLSTIMPQLLYCFECLVGSGMLLLTNRRLAKMIKMTSGTSLKGSKSISGVLVYIKTINSLLAITTFMECLGLGAINVDILGSRVIYSNKLLTDVFTRLFSFGMVLTPIFAIAIVYRPTSIIGGENSKGTALRANHVAPTSSVASTRVGRKVSGGKSSYSGVSAMSPTGSTMVAGGGADTSCVSPTGQDGVVHK